MKRRHLALAALLAFPAALAACGGGENREAESPATAADGNLTYAASESEPLTYRATCTQSLEIGKEEETLRGRRVYESTYVMKPEALAAGVKAYIILDGLSASESMADEQVVLDTSRFRGRSLILAMEPQGGSPWQLNHIPALDFGLASGDTLDSAFLFGYAFPRLPDEPIEEGDTWRESISGKRLEGNFLANASFTVVHTYAGMEEIDHTPCVKVESKTTGHVRGSQDRQGKRWHYTGTLEGTATWYFEPEHGVLVGYSGVESTEGREITDGTVNPVVQETKVDIVRVPEA